MENIFERFESKQKEEEPIVICRLTTSYWMYSNKKLILKKEISFLKKLSKGCNFILEDVYNIGAEEVIPRIININECKDGVYKLIITNVSTDWETGYVDDYDYKLIPYEHPSKDTPN
jgi:hypothetical protein